MPQAETVLDRLGGLFVGTIHAYCFRLLQTHVPRYETFDVLDDHQLTAFLAREATRLGLKQLDPKGRLFGSISRFLQGVDVIENELLDPATMPEPFGSVLLDYLAALERYRLLTFGQQVVRAVRELEPDDVRAQVHADLRHLVVDEYQDVNPAPVRGDPERGDARVARGERDDVGHVRPPPLVDGLVVVAHHAQLDLRPGEQLDQPLLRMVLDLHAALPRHRRPGAPRPRCHRWAGGAGPSTWANGPGSSRRRHWWHR